MVFRGMSADELNAMVDDLIDKRKDVIVWDPKTLKTLTILTVLKTYHQIPAHGSYINKPDLKILPNSIVQDFLQIMKIAHESADDKLLDDCSSIKLMKGLMNQQIREVNLNEFNPRCQMPIFLAHLKNCPNIRVFTHWADYFLEGKEHETHLLPFDQLGNWKNLEVLSVRGYLCDDEVIKKIQLHYPNLKELELMVSFDSFTMRSVDHMSKLKQLKRLYIKACYIEGQPNEGHVTDIIAHAAGNIPQLQKIQFDGAVEPKQFVETYVRFYSEKKLTIESLIFYWAPIPLVEVKTSSGVFKVEDTTFEDGWPSNVSFEEPTFLGTFPEAMLKIFKKQSMTMEKIKFCFSPAFVMYTLLEEFGSNITSLDISKVLEGEKLNLLKVLAACPILENLSFAQSLWLEDFDLLLEAGLSPLHFKNLKSLHYNHYLQRAFHDDDYTDISKLFKLFLLGSENYSRKLIIFTWQYEVVLEALEENPNCLNRLEEVIVPACVDNRFGQIAEMLPLVYKICTKLLLRCPRLRKICFKNLNAQCLLVTQKAKYALFHSVARKINLQVVYDNGWDTNIHYKNAACKFINDIENVSFIFSNQAE